MHSEHSQRSVAIGAEHRPGAQQADSLVARWDLSHTVAHWLVARGLTESLALEAFFSPRLSRLTQPDAMADRLNVTRRVADAIRGGEVIAVFGDYDCDGITSAAILTEAIEAFGGKAIPLVASRFEGGYGVSPAAVQRIVQTGARLLVTCDCGSSDHESLRQLLQLGIEAVVIDHHLVPDEPLPVVGFLNPHRPECDFPYKGMASCGLALSVAAALRKEMAIAVDVRQWLDLVAIGTIADVAPLDGDNRNLVRAGLDALKNPTRPGLIELLARAKLGGSAPLSGRDVGFRIAPHINAPGRLGSAQVALELLLARDRSEASRLAEQLVQLSATRRQIQEQMVVEAVAQIESEGFAEQSAIVVGSEGWNPGIVGIVAGRLADRYALPTIVIGWSSGDENPPGRGSARGPQGCRLYDALQESSNHLTRFGGHQAAAGLELNVSQLDGFRRAFCQAVERLPALPSSAVSPEVTLDPRDDLSKVLADLDRLEPCGEGNPRPRMVVSGRVALARPVKGGHLKLRLALASGQTLSGFAIQQGVRADELEGEITLVGDLRHNDFPGGAPVEMFVEEIRT